MAENSGTQPQKDGGGVVDGLTPLTVKFPEPVESEKTQIGPAPGASGARSVKSLAGTPTIANEKAGSTVHADIVIQDLLVERLLKDAPRVEHSGKQVPALNGIPLLTKIGQGGMGAVYFGVHPRLRCEVAVKVLPFHLAEQDPDMIRRFFREAQIAAQVRSPHLVNVMDVNEESGLFFLVMEYVPGASAGQLLKSVVASGHAGLPVLDALDIAIAATDGLHAAHSQGIIHRDLKPDNIMVPYLARETKMYNLKASKLMDLGLARSEEGQSQSLTGVQAAMGTPGYMAPEQALDAKTANRASDVFGMGATLYALLTGHAPFRNEAVMKVLMATMHEPHEPVIKIRPDIPALLSEIVDKCLDKKQENRYADALNLNRALKNCRRAMGGTSLEDGDSVGVDMAALSSSGRARSMTAMLPAPGSQATILTGQNATQQATMVANAGVAGATQTGGRKGMMLVAAALIAVLAIGGAIFAFTRPKVDPNAGAVVVVDPNTGGAPTQVADPAAKGWTVTDVEISKDVLSSVMQRIDASLVIHNVIAANNLLPRIENELKNIPPKDKIDPKEKEVLEYRLKLETDLKRYKDAIALEGKRSEYTSKLKVVDELTAKGEFEKAESELRVAAGILSTPEAKTEFKSRSDLIQEKISERDNRKSFEAVMKVASDFEKKEPEKALAEVTKALKLIPNDPAALRMESNLTKLIDLAKNKDLYAQKMKESKEAEANFPERALELANAARVLLPDEKLANEAIARINGTLGEVKMKEVQEKQRIENEKNLVSLIGEATNFVNKKDWTSASGSVKRAAALFMDAGKDTRVVDLQKQIDAGVSALQNSLEEKRKQDRFKKISENVLACIGMESWDEDARNKAQSLLSELKTLDAKNPQISVIEKKLADRAGYEKAIKSADEFIQKEQLESAAQQIKVALGFMPEGATAKDLEKVVKRSLFSKFVSAAESADKKEKFTEAMAQIAEAKKLVADDKTLLALEAKVKQKIDAWEANVKKRDDLKKSFTEWVAGIEKLEPEEADKKLNDFKTKMTESEFFKTELKPELGQIETRRTALQTKLAARLDGIIAGELSKIKDSLTKTKDLGAVVTSLQSLAQRFSNRKDVSDRLDCVKAVYASVSDLPTVMTNYDSTSTDLKAKVKGEEVEKTKLDAALAKLREIPNTAVFELIKADLLDSKLSGLLKIARLSATQEIDKLLADLQADFKKQNKKEPVKDPPKPDKPPKKTTGGGVGEGNMDD